jgi:hypothetical protein
MYKLPLELVTPLVVPLTLAAEDPSLAPLALYLSSLRRLLVLPDR